MPRKHKKDVKVSQWLQPALSAKLFWTFILILKVHLKRRTGSEFVCKTGSGYEIHGSGSTLWIPKTLLGNGDVGCFNSVRLVITTICNIGIITALVYSWPLPAALQCRSYNNKYSTFYFLQKRLLNYRYFSCTMLSNPFSKIKTRLKKSHVKHLSITFNALHQ